MPWNEFAQMQVYVPKMEQQRKIVESYKIVEDRIKLIHKINDNLEAQAETIYNEMIKNNSTRGIVSSLEYTSSIKTGKLNSEAAVSNGIYPFFTCSQETYRTNTFSFDQEAVLLAGNNASAVYPLKLFQGKFDAYQSTYVITSTNELVSNKQLYFILKQQLNEFKGISSGTAGAHPDTPPDSPARRCTASPPRTPDAWPSCGTACPSAAPGSGPRIPGCSR